MDDQDMPGWSDEYEVLSKRVLDIVLGALGLDSKDLAPELLSRAQGEVRGEFMRQTGAHIEGLHGADDRDHLLRQSILDRDALREAGTVLEGERDLLDTIMDSTQAQIAYLDREFNFVLVNSAYCQGSGHAKEELVGRNHFDLFPDDQNRATFERVRDTGEAAVFRGKPFAFLDQPERGTTYWDWTLVPVKDGRGTVQGLVLSLYDVTEQERARQAREERLARLRILIEVSEQIIVETSAVGVLERAVDAAVALTGARIATSGYGYRDGTFQVGAAVSEEGVSSYRLGERPAGWREEVYADLINGAVSVQLTAEELHAQQAGCVPLQGLLGVRLVDGEGQTAGLIMVADKAEGDFATEDEALLGQLASLTSLALRNVQSQVESEYQRRRSEFILRSAGEGILGLDAKGKVTFANPAAGKMLGWKPEELQNMPAHSTIHHTQSDGTDYSLEECLVHSTLEDGVAYSVGDEVFWRQDGTSFPVEYTSAPIGEGTETEGAVLVFRDITERKQAQEAIADLARFPGENPYPVIRISREGTLLYANRGSQPILAEWGVQVGQQVPDHWQTVVATAMSEGGISVEEASIRERVFALAIAPLEEYANVYGLEITSLKRAETSLQRYTERLRVLREVDGAILAAQTAEEIAAAALRHMRRLVPFLQASVALFDAEAGEMSLLTVYPESRETDRTWRHPLAEDSFLSDLKEGKARVIEDVAALVSPSTLTKALEVQGVRAYIRVPLIAHSTLIGLLDLGWASPGEPDEEAIEIVQETADELAIGIQQARLLTRVQRHAEELERQVRRRTAALRVSRARFQAVFEEAALGIALVNRRGRILDSNPALQRMLGYEQNELAGMAFSELAHPENVADDAGLYEELVAGQRTYYRIEGRYVRKDGQSIDANLTVSLVRPAKGRVRFAIALVEDVTERKQAQDALIESEKLALTGRMAASLAHEINNPLQSVIGCLSLAEEDLAEGRDALRYVEIALEELERAADLIGRMRDLNRPHRAEEQMPTDANALVERVLTLTKKKCEERHVDMTWEPGTNLPKASMVADRMQQVFLNLVLNAVEAMPEGGQLAVWTEPTSQPEGARVCFADSGGGIPAEDLPHLFEPFYTTKSTGIGLGLYISHSIVENHGGRIDVESVEGKGTTFVVWLPVHRKEE